MCGFRYACRMFSNAWLSTSISYLSLVNKINTIKVPFILIKFVQSYCLLGQHSSFSLNPPSWENECCALSLPWRYMLIRRKAAVLILGQNPLVIPNSIWSSLKSKTILMDAFYPPPLWGQTGINCVANALCVPCSAHLQLQLCNVQVQICMVESWSVHHCSSFTENCDNEQSESWGHIFPFNHFYRTERQV